MPDHAGPSGRWIGGEWILDDLDPGALPPAWSVEALSSRCGPGAFAASGRAALALCLRRLGARIVLLPAYGCPALTQGVALAGARPAYYPGDAEMRPQWALLPDLARRSGADTLLIVHPLGMLQDAGEVRRVTREWALKVVEDASHTLCNAADSLCLGPQATAALIAGLRKTLPVPSGGVWTVWGEAPPDPPPVAGGPFASARGQAFALPPGPMRHRALARAEQLLDGEAGGPGVAPDAWAALQRLEGSASPAAVAWRARCRDNWAQLRDGLHGTACRPLFSALPPGVCPAGFAVRAPDRTRLARLLLRRGIEAVLHWPIAPEAREALSRGERLLAGTVLTLPCDARYGPGEMERIIGAVSDFERGA